MTARPRIMAMAKPTKISAPVKSDVCAFTKPEAFDRWKAGVKASTSSAQTITIYDVIGEDFWSGGGVTVNRIDAALRKIGDQAVEVHINSPGGDMFEGIAIYNRLLEHKQPITVKVMGLAASAASIIAMAGDQVLIGPASFMMIHNCWVIASGDRNDMRETADFLAPFDAAMAGVYAQRTGLKLEEIAAMLDAETWLSGQQAIDKSFADGLLQPDDMQESEADSMAARSLNELRANEAALVRAGLPRDQARERTTKISGWSSAPLDPDMGDLSWLGDVATLTQALRG